MNVSLCTGGAFTIASDIALQSLATSESGPMSYGSIGYLSCKSTSRDDKTVSAESGQCDDASACLSELNATTRQRLSKMIKTDVDSTYPSLASVHSIATEHSYEVAFVGPLYPHPEINAHILLKRE